MNKFLPLKKWVLSIVLVSLVAAWVPSVASGGAGLDGSFGPTRNLWIDQSTLMALPTSGAAWDRLAGDATGSWGSADVSDQNSDHDVLTFAGALYAVRQNDPGMRSRVVSAIESAIGTEQGGRTLALGRNLTGYVLAADLVGYDSARFRNWLTAVRSASLDGRSLIDTNAERPNNWGTHAGAARIAADLFLGDSSDLDRTAKIFYGLLGDRSAYAGFNFGDSDWQANPSAPVPINPAGATRDGVVVDGALVDDIRRCGCSVSSPAPRENYQWEAMQGIATQATLLYAAGYDDVWTRSDSAIGRAVRFLYEQADFPAEGDDAFVLFLLDAGLGTNYAGGEKASMGKSIAYTDFTHPNGRPASTRSRPIPTPTFTSPPRSTEPMRFVPVQPARLFDTRTAEAPSGRLAAGQTIDVQVTGRAGVPYTSDVGAVVLNVTATGAAAAGFVSVWPTGEAPPPTSSVNVTQPGQTVPNLVTVPVGQDGKVSFYTLGELDLLADVSGYFVETADTKAGRYVPLPPERAFDTRDAAAPSGLVGDDSTISVQLAGQHGIPDSGAAVAVINLTAVGVNGPGFITMYPSGTDRPLASSLNVNGAGDVRSVLAFAPLGEDGRVNFYSLTGAHLIGDVVGYFTDDSARRDTAGMFVATNSVRHVDTRFSHPNDDARRLDARAEQDYAIGGDSNVPTKGVSAILTNITGTEAAGPGFFSVWKRGDARPNTSNVNLPEPGATRSNAAIVEMSSGRDVSLYSLEGAHAIIDVFGYFTD